MAYYNDKGIAVFLTFSNLHVTKDHLNDASTNRLLDDLWRKGRQKNGVIIGSDLVNDYVKHTFPGLVRKASSLKIAADTGNRDVAYYQRVLDSYDCLNLHPDDSLNIALLRQLVQMQSRVEVLVNECCLVGCQKRSEHYDLLSRIQMEQANLDLNERMIAFDETSCDSFDMTKQLSSSRRNLNVSSEELGLLYELGFRTFKLQGRADYDHVFLFDCSRFLFEPEVTFPLVFKLMCSSQRYGVVKSLGRAAELLKSR